MGAGARPLVPHEDRQQDAAARQGRQRHGVEQSGVGQGDQAEGHAGQAGEGQQCARPVDAARRLGIDAFGRRRQAIQRAARQSNGLMKKIACQGR